MNERFMNTLPELNPEDFESMMNDDVAPVKLPYGMDVMIVPPESASAEALHCGIDTGDGSGDEDEYPPVYDPTIGGSVTELN